MTKELIEELDRANKTLSTVRTLLNGAITANQKKGLSDNIESAMIRIEMVRNSLRTN